MARAQNTDYMQGFRFHAVALDDESLLEFSAQEGLPGGQAGFQSVTIPDISTDAVEYREGTMTWTRKQPGPPTVGEATLSRGICIRDTKFFDWMYTKVIGGKEYRTDILIYHYHRSEQQLAAAGGPANATRKYILHECFPSMAKLAGDLEATSGDISLAEITLVCEEITYDLT
jgi:phage tail-like protein